MVVIYSLIFLSSEKTKRLGSNRCPLEHLTDQTVPILLSRRPRVIRMFGQATRLSGTHRGSADFTMVHIELLTEHIGHRIL